MVSRLRARAGRIAIPAALIAGALVLAQPAAATDFCVGGGFMCGPGGSTVPDLQTALDFAGLAPDSDRIILSAKTFTAPDTGGFHYAGSGPVEIDGVDRLKTILTGPAQSSKLLDLQGGPGTAINNLSIELPQMAGASTAVFTNATVKGVIVTEPTPQAINHLGVSLVGDGTLADSAVTMDPGTSTTGVALGGSATITNSTVSARTAVASVYGGLIERSWLTGAPDALVASGGTTSLENSVIRVNGGAGTGIRAFPNYSAHPIVNADGLTMVSGLGGAQFGFDASVTNAGQTVEVNLKNSVLRGFDIPIQATGSGGGAATVTTSYSDYDASKTQATGDAQISKSNISNVADPGFVNPIGNNFRLTPGSALVDAGDPSTPQGLDMDGNPLVTDGNADGIFRRDIGAYEAPGPLPPDPSPADTGGGGSPPADPGSAGSGDQPPAETTTPATGSSADTLAPVISGLASSHRRFAVGRARTAIAALAQGTTLRYALSEAAKVTITIRRAGSRRAAGTLRRSAAQGANAVKFSGRIGKRALKPGRYLAAVTATDAAGNRSAAKRVRFRIVARRP